MITCQFEDGKQTALRHMTLGALVANDKNEVLLTKRADHLRQAGKWCIPGGYLDRDETTQQGTLRELTEETGIIGTIDCLFRFKDDPERAGDGDRQNLETIYAITPTGGEATITHEVAELKWFNRDNLPPEADFAFDHRDTILRYFDYLENKFPVPIIG